MFAVEESPRWPAVEGPAFSFAVGVGDVLEGFIDWYVI
jgi:hypothetical protein